MAQRTVERTRTIGLALSSCQIPGAAAPNFTITPGEVEMGMGIHGEPGIWRRPIRPADELVDEMIGMLLAERPEGAGRVSILVNSLGATPFEELFILYRRAAQQLEAAGLTIVRPLVGPYVTSMEMGGASISLCFLDPRSRSCARRPTVRSGGGLIGGHHRYARDRDRPRAGQPRAAWPTG